MWTRHFLLFVICIALVILIAGWQLRPKVAASADDKGPAAVDRKPAQDLLEAAKEAYEGYIKRRQIDPTAPNDPEFLYRWSGRWLNAERSLGNTRNKRVAALKGHLERMRKLEADEQGHLAKFELSAVTFYRIEAEQWLAEEKAR